MAMIAFSKALVFAMRQTTMTTAQDIGVNTVCAQIETHTNAYGLKNYLIWRKNRDGNE